MNRQLLRRLAMSIGFGGASFGCALLLSEPTHNARVAGIVMMGVGVAIGAFALPALGETDRPEKRRGFPLD